MPVAAKAIITSIVVNCLHLKFRHESVIGVAYVCIERVAEQLPPGSGVCDHAYKEVIDEENSEPGSRPNKTSSAGSFLDHVC